jgi:hypothetical protein
MGRFRWGLVAALLGLGAGCLTPQREVVVLRPPRPEAEVKRDGPRTLAYWQALGTSLTKERTMRTPERPSLGEMLTWGVKQMVSEIQELPVVDVDPDALEFGDRLVEQLREMAEGMNELRWYHVLGWPLPERVRVIDGHFRALRKDMEGLRVTLSQRYKLPFPVLDMPPVP